jgi:hypothetical protein
VIEFTVGIRGRMVALIVSRDGEPAVTLSINEDTARELSADLHRAAVCLTLKSAPPPSGPKEE